MPAEAVLAPPPLPLSPVTEGPGVVPPLIPVRDPGVCANCGLALQGPFCSACGQSVRDIHRSIWRFVADFFDNAFCWDNKLFLTLKPLLTRPGALTLDYLSGRRVRYVHPFRLFLFTSAVCLTLMQSLSKGPIDAGISDDSPAAKKGRHQRGVNVQFDDSQEKSAPAASPTPAAATNASPEPSPAGTPPAEARRDGDTEDWDPSKGLVDQINRTVAEKVKDAKFKVLNDNDPGDAQFEQWLNGKVAAAGGMKGVREKINKINEDVQRRLSWVALAMLPIFAMMLRALYWRRDSYYFAHFVFSLHYHTFLLLFGASYLLLQWAVPASFGWLHELMHLCLLVPGVYLFLALRRMYGDRLRRTFLKVCVLGTMHLCTLVMGLAAVGALASYKQFKSVGEVSAPAVPAVPKLSTPAP